MKMIKCTINPSLCTLSLCVLSMCVAMTTAATSGKPTLQIVWMVPFANHPSTTSYIYNASSSVSALALGLDTVKNLQILTQFDPNVTVIDSGCNSKQSLGALVDLIYQIDIDVVIGPPCAHVVPTIAELMSYRDIAMVNWVSLGQTISDKGAQNNLNTYIRTMAPMSSLGGIMLYFFYNIAKGWHRFVIISSDGADFIAGSQIIENNLAGHKKNGFIVVHHYSQIHLTASTNEIDSILQQIKHEGRIIILVIPRNLLRRYMLRAHALGMTSGDYQFLFTETKLMPANDLRVIKSDVLWKQNDTDDDAARQAFENVLIFALGHNTTSASQWGLAANMAYNKHFRNRTDVPRPTEPDQFAGYLHDALVLYAMTLNKSLAENFTGRGSDIFLWASKIHFRGLSGNVAMNSNGDRQPAFFVYDLGENGVFRQVASFLFAINPKSDTVYVINSFTDIIWGDGTKTPQIPIDTPVCGFLNEKCPRQQPDDNILLVALATSVPILVLVVVLYIMYRWWRWAHSIRNMSWKINSSDLDYSLSRRAYAASIRRHLTRSMSFTSHSSADGPTSRDGASPAPRDPADVASGVQIFTQIARYNGDIVAVKRSLRKKITLDTAFLLEMKHMMAMKHGNLTNFIGVCTAPEKICSVWEYCNKGSLQDVIENDDIKLDAMFKMSMAVDICQGLDYIHKSPLKFHGSLRSSNCVIDNRWVCKLTDFGLRMLKIRQDFDEIGEHAYYAGLFWAAPEVLRKILNKEQCEGTQQSDVYALGVIIKELMCRNEAYAAYSGMTPKEIIYKVAFPEDVEDIFRPGIQECELWDDSRRQNMEYLIQRCWAEDPDDRPVVKAVLRTINKLNPYKKASVVDNMISMMEKYTNNLEDVVAERTEQLRDEKKKTDELLYRMLPQKVAEDLKFGRAVQAEAFDSVTIYFSDIVHFTALASESTPLQIVEFLNALYTLFDDIIQYYDVYKVETIGDAYMVVSGLPERNGQQHAKEIAGVALDILNNIMNFKIPHDHDRQLEIRIGLHTGSVVAGVVGLTMPRYCLFGDTVNTASRMESTGKPLKIHISSTTRDALQQYSNFTTEDRGEIPVKGKGLMKTYWLTGIYQAGEEMQQTAFHKSINLDQDDEHVVDVLDAHETDNSLNALQVPEGSECKVSVADSGIVSDKCIDEKDTTISGNEVRSVWMEDYAVGKDSNMDKPRNIRDKRQTYVNALIALAEEDTFHARNAWPKLSSVDDFDMNLTTESDDDGLYETVLNHFMEKERKVSKHNHGGTNDITTTLNVDQIFEEESGSTSPKSHSKRGTPKGEIKRKKKRRKKNVDEGDLSLKDLDEPGVVRLQVPKHSGAVDTDFYLDGLAANDDTEAGISDENGSHIKPRTVKSANNSPRNKLRNEKASDGHRKASWYNGGVIF